MKDWFLKIIGWVNSGSDDWLHKLLKWIDYNRNTVLGAIIVAAMAAIALPVLSCSPKTLSIIPERAGKGERVTEVELQHEISAVKETLDNKRAALAQKKAGYEAEVQKLAADRSAEVKKLTDNYNAEVAATTEKTDIAAADLESQYERQQMVLDTFNAAFTSLAPPQYAGIAGALFGIGASVLGIMRHRDALRKDTQIAGRDDKIKQLEAALAALKQDTVEA